ncbi:hypothetical protein [Modestobacter lapidis]|nr:hypothetical protein [Modestobacter lapidis]
MDASALSTQAAGPVSASNDIPGAQATGSLSSISFPPRRLTAAGLTAVGASQFTVTDSDPAIAVLAAVDVVDPYLLLDVVADLELGVALDLGLSSLPPGRW